ncbi:hypothetical protein TIFTF001_024668 [Ficus carica]|uniref:Response regulatory domain-containing protein n=1 Tax=Ficus carica TaxID=3494 RepID=A0AA88ANQ7_FICCA|nr:hypothetical protein TIFTF001_024668 [Ficus carica]
MGLDAEAQFHVLAVDDSIIDRKLIETLLKSSSYHVTAVDSGSKALEFLGLHEEEEEVEQRDVNLIITDYCMPGMTGYDLLRKIKMLARWGRRILFETSSVIRCEQA